MNLERKILSVKDRKVNALLFAHIFLKPNLSLVSLSCFVLDQTGVAALRKHPNMEARRG